MENTYHLGFIYRETRCEKTIYERIGIGTDNDIYIVLIDEFGNPIVDNGIPTIDYEDD